MRLWATSSEISKQPDSRLDECMHHAHILLIYLIIICRFAIGFVFVCRFIPVFCDKIY